MRPFAKRRRRLLAVAAYACVGLCYCAFFAMPVSPAEPSEVLSFEIEDRVYSALPSIHETLYTNGKAFIAIATIRTISTPSSAYSMAFERLDDYAEDHVRNEYGIDVDIVVESRESGSRYAGHSATMYTYGVFKDIAVFLISETVKVAEIVAIAWFCNVDFESVIVFYVVPWYFADDPSLLGLRTETLDVVGAVSCH